MKRSRLAQQKFIGFTFIWSFLFWGIGIFIAISNKVSIPENVDLLSGLLNNNISKELYKITLVNTLAGYGPLLGALFIIITIPETKKFFRDRFKALTPIKYIVQIVGLFVFITLMPVIPIALSRGVNQPLSLSLLGYFILFFIYQFITAATEEIGWRGYLLPSMLKKKTPWKASVDLGIVWALWHTPIILYVFYSQGLPIYQIIMSFVGYIAGTIAMSTIHTYYYLKAKNILFNMFIHAISNTIPMFVGMMFASTYMVSVAVQVLLWVFVLLITNKNKKLFDTVLD